MKNVLLGLISIFVFVSQANAEDCRKFKNPAQQKDCVARNLAAINAEKANRQKDFDKKNLLSRSEKNVSSLSSSAKKERAALLQNQASARNLASDGSAARKSIQRDIDNHAKSYSGGKDTAVYKGFHKMQK